MRIRKYKIALLIGSLCALALIILNNKNSSNKAKEIGIIQISEHECLDKARIGFIDRLSKLGYKEGENIKIEYQNASGDQNVLNQIANNFTGLNKKDMIFAISTPVAQTVSNLENNTPILITAVTDPESCGLIKENITGTHDMIPVEKQISLIKKLLPNAKKVGILYSSAEINSKHQAEIAKGEAEKLGLQAKDYTISNLNELEQVTEYMAGQVDVIFVPTDNLVVSSMPLVSKCAEKRGIPIICSETASVKNGALATYGIDYYNLGKLTAEKAAEVLSGKKPKDIPIETLSDIKLTLNEKVAEKLNIKIPENLKGEIIK